MLEAIAETEKLVGKKLSFTLSDQARAGDHIWWVSDVRAFSHDYPAWKYRYGMSEILKEIVEAASERYSE